MKLPQKPKLLPQIILTPEIIRLILRTPDTGTDSGDRDRIILELLYDSAFRRTDLK